MSRRSRRWLTSLILVLGLAATPVWGPGPARAATAKPAAAPASASGQTGSWWALLIAIQDYPEANAAGLPRLNCCYQDLTAVKNDWLIGANVPEDRITFLHDQKPSKPDLRPTKENIERRLNALNDRVKETDMVLIAVSSHGLYRDGASHIVCPGAAAGNLEYLSLKEIIAGQLAKCPARYKLLIVDACRNPIDGGVEKAGAMGDFVQFFHSEVEASAKAAAPPARKKPQGAASRSRTAEQAAEGSPTKGVAVLTSCSVGERSVEFQDVGHGAFTYALLEGLSGPADELTGNNDGVVSLREAASYASARTARLVAKKFQGHTQTPDLFLGEKTLNMPLVRLSKKRQGGQREGDVDFMLRTGNELSKRKENDLAIDTFTHVIRAQPLNALAYNYRGVSYRAQRDYVHAIGDFQKAGHEMELMVESKGGAEIVDQDSQRHKVLPGQRLAVTRAEDRGLWVAAVDHGRSGNVQGWIQSTAVGWDPGLVDIYRPVSKLNSFRATADERLARAQQIVSRVPYVPSYVGMGLGIARDVGRLRRGEIAPRDLIRRYAPYGGMF